LTVEEGWTLDKEFSDKFHSAKTPEEKREMRKQWMIRVAVEQFNGQYFHDVAIIQARRELEEMKIKK
jgi:hypothetical protein